MTRHGRLLIHILLPSMAVAVLIASHGFILYYVSSNMALSAAAISGLIVLLVIKHLGLLGPLYALFGGALGQTHDELIFTRLPKVAQRTRHSA
jgi:hypothetical protein